MPVENTRNFTRFLLYAGLILLAFRLLTMALTPMVEPSELRYANLSANMARHLNFLDPMFVHDGTFQCFEGKPPLPFQVGGLCGLVFGINEFAVRFQSMIFALLTLGTLYFTARRCTSKTIAFWSTALTFFSGAFFIFAGLSMTDMALCFTVVLALCAYILFASVPPGREKTTYSLLFFIALALGMLAKGIVAVALSGMPVFLFVLLDKRWAELKYHAWFSGFFIFFIITLPWYILMAQKYPDFLEYFFINENFKRFLTQSYGDKYGVGHPTIYGMSVIWFIAANLPGLLLLYFPLCRPRARKCLIALKNFRAEPVRAISFSVCIVMVGFWALTSRSLLPYLLPTIPFCSLFLVLNFVYLRPADFFKLQKTACMILPIAAVCIVIGLLGYTVLGPLISPRMSRPVCTGIIELMSADSRLNHTSVFFAERTPYGAEFYLGDRIPVVRHVHLGWDESVRQSRNSLFAVIRKDETDRVHDGGLKIENRAVLWENRQWRIYAPEPPDSPADTAQKHPPQTYRIP